MLKFTFYQPILLIAIFLLGCFRDGSKPVVTKAPAETQTSGSAVAIGSPKGSAPAQAESFVIVANSATMSSELTSDTDSDTQAPDEAAGRSESPKIARPEVTEDDGTFRVMSWNLEWFFDNESGDNFSELAKQQTLATRQQWDWKRDAVARAIFEARPSVVGLQEIENKRVLFYLRRSLARNHNVAYQELNIEGSDFFTEQDVGLMYRSNADTEASGSKLPIIDPVRVASYGRTRLQRQDKTLSDVTKQLAVTFEVMHGDAKEQVTIVNVHLRAKEEGVAIRTRQARMVHAWVADRIRRGENVIVLGDINTEESSFPAQPGSDMHALMGLETPDIDDDLIDLNANLSVADRQTHLLKNKMFDRILVSPALIADDPSRVDLVFSKMQRLRELSVQGEVDEPEQHWDHYWQLSDDSRDISDHWPIMATFQWK